jgi:haloalkane dehalogenase
MIHRRIVMASLCLLAAALSVNVIAQNTSSKPLIYKDLSFPDLPYPSKWVEVDGMRMHYIEGGNLTADPILFLHGVPTWSYIWRDVMPVVEPAGHVIALDYVGFGRSDKLPSDQVQAGYSFTSQLAYLEGFIEAMDLHHITLVVQDLGSAVGLAYAALHPENVRGIVFFEAAIPPLVPPSPEGFAQLDPAVGAFFQQVFTPDVGPALVLDQNVFVEQLIPANVVRKLSDAEMNAYRAPFPTTDDRLAILWGGPMNFANPDSIQLMSEYVAWMPTTTLPMLYLYATPGSINPPASLEWVKKNLQNVQIQLMGKGGHFFQEDHPQAIGQAIVTWLSSQ